MTVNRLLVSVENVFSGLLRLDAEFTDELNDPGSAEYRRLAADIEREVGKGPSGREGRTAGWLDPHGTQERAWNGDAS